MIPFDAPPAGEILGAMITPAVLISASGTLILSTSHRLGRVVDRVRVLHSEAELLPPWSAVDEDALAKRALIADQIARQSERIELLQSSLRTLYVAIGLLVATSFSIGLSAVAAGWFSWVPVLFGLFGSVALFTGAVMLIREARLAVRSTLSELEYIKRMVARRTGAPLPPPKLDARVQTQPASGSSE
jgi:hypothetical protein